MTRPLTIAHNATVAKLIGATREIEEKVCNLLSFMVDGHEHMHAFKTTGWDGRSSFYSFRTHTFPAGFVHLVNAELTKAGLRPHIVRKPLPTPLGPESPIVDEFGNDDPRYDFQLKALRQVEKHGRGIIQVATGGGKSKIAKLIIARYRRMALFLTTRGVLMYQMKDDLEHTCKFNTGVVGDGEWAPVKGINVGMVQTFVAQLKEPNHSNEILEVRKQNVNKSLGLTEEQMKVEADKRVAKKTAVRNRAIKFLSLFEVVIGEEAHEAGGNSYYEILRHCTNAKIRVALTATPFMRESAEDNMRLMAAFGPILLKVSEKLLIDRGILATPYFLYANPEPAPKLRRTSPWQRAYELEVVNGPGRNSDVIHFAKKAVDHGLPVMILVQRKKHGDPLVDTLEELGIRAEFIQGENDQAERKRALKALGAGKVKVLIGTTILDVGVDVPAVGMVILAGGGKAEVGLRQRIGRGLRAKKNGPNVAFIVDFQDPLNGTLRDHARTRRAIVEATPGFAENILSAGADFPWHHFQRKSAA